MARRIFPAGFKTKINVDWRMGIRKKIPWQSTVFRSVGNGKSNDSRTRTLFDSQRDALDRSEYLEDGLLEFVLQSGRKRRFPHDFGRSFQTRKSGVIEHYVPKGVEIPSKIRKQSEIPDCRVVEVFGSEKFGFGKNVGFHFISDNRL
jgi:hypothetical protein